LPPRPRHRRRRRRGRGRRDDRGRRGVRRDPRGAPRSLPPPHPPPTPPPPPLAYPPSTPPPPGPHPPPPPPGTTPARNMPEPPRPPARTTPRRAGRFRAARARAAVGSPRLSKGRGSASSAQLLGRGSLVPHSSSTLPVQAARIGPKRSAVVAASRQRGRY